MGDIGYSISLVELKTKTVLGSWIRCVSIMVPGSHLRRQWCRTCRRRPGTCAAPRWASPSSGRLPSSHTDVKAFWSEVRWSWSGLIVGWKKLQLESLVASEAGWLPRPQPYACHSATAWRPNRVSDSIIQTPLLLLGFRRMFLIQDESWHTWFPHAPKVKIILHETGLNSKCQFWLHNKIYLAHYFRGI